MDAPTIEEIYKRLCNWLYNQDRKKRIRNDAIERIEIIENRMLLFARGPQMVSDGIYKKDKIVADALAMARLAKRLIKSAEIKPREFGLPERMKDVSDDKK